MPKVIEFDVYLTETTKGAFLAATSRSPYFCVEGGSEADVIEKTKHLLKFYVANRDKSAPRPIEPLQVRTFSPKRVVSSRDLTPA